MANDEPDNPGFLLPPPLTYLLPLLFGLLLDRTIHVPFLPRSLARSLGWPLLGGGVLLNGWIRALAIAVFVKGSSAPPLVAQIGFSCNGWTLAVAWL